jgi:hypothetical protein
VLLHFLLGQKGYVFEPIKPQSLEAVFALRKLPSGFKAQSFKLEDQLMVGQGHEGSKFSEFVMREHLVNELPIYQIGGWNL